MCRNQRVAGKLIQYRLKHQRIRPQRCERLSLVRLPRIRAPDGAMNVIVNADSQQIAGFLYCIILGSAQHEDQQCDA